MAVSWPYWLIATTLAVGIERSQSKPVHTGTRFEFPPGAICNLALTMTGRHARVAEINAGSPVRHRPACSAPARSAFSAMARRQAGCAGRCSCSAGRSHAGTHGHRWTAPLHSIPFGISACERTRRINVQFYDGRLNAVKIAARLRGYSYAASLVSSSLRVNSRSLAFRTLPVRSRSQIPDARWLSRRITDA